jgi:hypothetical protein
MGENSEEKLLPAQKNSIVQTAQGREHRIIINMQAVSLLVEISEVLRGSIM